ncbi:hypothetical protein RD110_10065 [Rhodoferax koreense]|uniref:Acyltransferase 3 domain-containing protein n=2 Tax=Rhodoferax koreensis TaxID=1842727 RepID=A0A1P8JUR5_9BURK|nr:hypothetical protein RD110_10065 [Rhodoferax koreense]
MEGIKGFTTGFDYLRFGLSLAVLIWHSYLFTFGLSEALELATNWSGRITYWILPMFFALSGFLITSSLSRTPSIKKFLWLRFIRIYPALTVEVILSALILGLLATSFSIRQYFSDPAFYRYLLNILGWIHYELPGVFLENPLPNLVNTSLWTVPFELECYIALTLLALFGLRKWPGWFLVTFTLLCLIKTVVAIYIPITAGSSANVNGRHLVLFFIAGVLININREKIPFSGALAILSTLLGALFLYNYQFIYLAPFPVAYLTIWLGLQRPKRIPYVMDGDYSYGIYLYAAPIQQAVWHFTVFGKTYVGNVILSIILTSIFAVFSWHAIEKPMLRFKKMF